MIRPGGVGGGVWFADARDRARETILERYNVCKCVCAVMDSALLAFPPSYFPSPQCCVIGVFHRILDRVSRVRGDAVGHRYDNFPPLTRCARRFGIRSSEAETKMGEPKLNRNTAKKKKRKYGVRQI